MEEKPDLQQKNAVPGIFPYKVTDAVKTAKTATYLRVNHVKAPSQLTVHVDSIANNGLGHSEASLHNPGCGRYYMVHNNRCNASFIDGPVESLNPAGVGNVAKLYGVSYYNYTSGPNINIKVSF